MTEGAIGALHGAPQRARVSRHVYPAGDRIEGRSRSGTAYVAEGTLTFAASEGAASFKAGDIFVFDGGDYEMMIGDATAAVVIWAWKLPSFA